MPLRPTRFRPGVGGRQPKPELLCQFGIGWGLSIVGRWLSFTIRFREGRRLRKPLFASVSGAGNLHQRGRCFSSGSTLDCAWPGFCSGPPSEKFSGGN